MLPFVVFLAMCLLTSALALALKKACQFLLPQKYYPFASEFCCTFIVVANVFENGNMIESYGLSVFAVTLFLLILIYMNLFDAFANPVSTFDLVWNKKKPLWDGVFTIICQVAGGAWAESSSSSFGVTCSLPVSTSANTSFCLKRATRPIKSLSGRESSWRWVLLSL